MNNADDIVKALHEIDRTLFFIALWLFLNLIFG